MNFLSHFYFDRHTLNSERVIGMVLPDLLKNAKKEWNIRPEKYEEQYTDNYLKNIYTGWKRHIEVDRYFHCSDFFLEHTKAIRTAITPVLTTSPARPFFVAHIALELMLDSLLLKNKLINTSSFYISLEKSNKTALNNFFYINNITEPVLFFSFLNEFIDAKYLNTYINPNEIIYALHRICMRVWDDPFNETQKLQLKAVLIEYQENLQQNFMKIFEEIELKLNLPKA